MDSNIQKASLNFFVSNDFASEICLAMYFFVCDYTYFQRAILEIDMLC